MRLKRRRSFLTRRELNEPLCLIEEPDEDEEDEEMDSDEEEEESEENLMESTMAPHTRPPYSLIPPPPVWVQRNQGLGENPQNTAERSHELHVNRVHSCSAYCCSAELGRADTREGTSRFLS